MSTEHQPPTPTPAPLWSINDLADHLNVKVSTVRSWRTAGDGPPAIRVAGSIRWRQADVHAWLDANVERGGAA